jgi:uncharacterized protein YndB with AHSA1/START domain
MTRIQVSTVIQAPPAVVWEVLQDPETYRAWTAAFCEGSTFEGSWAQGERIRFLAPNGSGMVAEIAENRPHERLSIKLLGTLEGGREDLDSPAVRAWAPAFETYTFTPVAGGTELRVDQDTSPEAEPFLRAAWPKALDRLKALAEGRPAGPGA